MNRGANTDLLAGICGLAMVGIFLYGRGEVGRLSIMFPNAILIILGAFSAALVIKGFVRPHRKHIFSEGDRVRIIGTCAILFAWAAAIPYAGFFVASVAGFWGLTCYLASSRRKVTLLQAGKWLGIVLAEVTFFYLIFAKLLYVPLPKGVLF